MLSASTQYVPMEKVKNFLRIPVITPDGVKLSEVVYRDTVFPYFHDVAQEPDLKKHGKDYPVVIVQWGMTLDGKTFDVTSDDLEKEVTFEGNVYLANRWAGTQVKERRTLAVRYDVVPFFQRFVSYAEQATKIQRCAIPMGQDAWHKQNLRVIYAKDGTVLGKNGRLVIEDGFGYIAADLVSNYTGPRVSYKHGRQHSQVWQDIAWTPDFANAAETAIKNYFEAVGTRRDIFYEELEKTDFYKRLVDLNPMMEQHPFTQKKVAGRHSQWFLEKLSTLPVLMGVSVAAPIPRHIPYLPGTMEAGIYYCHRYPKTSPVGTYVHRVKKITNEMYDWHTWLKSNEGFQYTLTNQRESWKGVFMVVDRSEMPGGVDIVTSASNVKLGPGRMRTVGKHMDKGETYEYIMDVDTIIVVTQWYSKGSFGGINMTYVGEDGKPAAWAGPAQAFDCDGDLKFEGRIRDERIAKAIEASQIDDVLSLKVKKTRSNADRTSHMLSNAFLGGIMVGQWTNLRAWYLSLPERNRKSAQIKMYEAHLFEDDIPDRLINEPSHKAVIMYFSLRIQEAVDAPKSMYADMWERRKEASGVQAILSSCGDYGESLKSPGFIHWNRSEGAGKRYLPGFISDLPDWMRVRAQIDREFRTKTQRWIDSTPDPMAESTIGQIMSLAQPYVERVWDSSVDVHDTLPLSEYVSWAGVVQQEIVELAQNVFFPEWKKHLAQNQHEQQLGLFDPTDVEDVHKRHATWAAIAQHLTEVHFKGDRWLAARALWIAAHSTHRGEATAAIVFVGFREECIQIVSRAEREHMASVKTLAIGLQYHFAGTPPVEFSATVKIVGRKDSPGRKAIVALTEVHNLLKGGNDGFPPFSIGAVQKLERPHIKAGYLVPDEGIYEAAFRYVEGTRSWAVSLVAAEE
jgi:hypothetical protein